MDKGRAFDYYQHSYQSAQRKGLQGWGNGLIDRLIERQRVKCLTRYTGLPQRNLEIGVSSGEHFRFVNESCIPPQGSYVGLDLNPGITNPQLFAQVIKDQRFQFVQGDAVNMPFESDAFDMAISTCVLAHVRDPEMVFSELRRVTRSGGTIIVGMPCDPGLANRTVKSLVTYRSMRKAGVANPKLSYAREHINGISNLVALAKHTFRNDDADFRWFPTGVASWNLNLVCLLTVRVTS